MIRGLALGCALLAGLGCAGAPGDPETEIRALLDDLSRASRERDLDALRDRVSERYADGEGRDKDDIEALIAAHYLRGGTVYLLLLLRALEPDPDGGTARAQVLAGMARVPLDDWSALRRTRGDVYVFDLELARESATWRVTRARWEPATLRDLGPAA